MTTKSEIISKSYSFFDDGYACSQSVLLAFYDQFNLDERTAKLISSTFGSGMGCLLEKCGAITGGFMVIGLAMGNELPKDMETKLHVYREVRELHKQFKEIHGTINCKELLQKYATSAQFDDQKHHSIICRQLVSCDAALVFDVIKGEGLI